MSWELYIEPVRLQRDPKTGRFLKGCQLRKGMKVTSAPTALQIETRKRNLAKGHGRHPRPVIALDDRDRVYRWFASVSEASSKIGLSKVYIYTALRNRKRRAGGYRWVYDRNDYALQTVR